MPPSLLGRWGLSRTMTDYRSGEQGSATGEVVVSTGRTGLQWTETVQLNWAGRVVPATRTYLLVDGDDGWWVRFDDERPFHPWRPGEEVEHLCGPDVYRGLVTVDGANVRVRWHVTGPAKDLLLQTVLSQ